MEVCVLIDEEIIVLILISFWTKWILTVLCGAFLQVVNNILFSIGCFQKIGPKMLDHEGKEVPGNRGYKWVTFEIIQTVTSLSNLIILFLN